MKSLLNKVLISIFLILFTTPVFAKDVKFIQISDLRLMPDEESIENYQRAVSKINNTKKLDFVVFTGDNIGGPNEDLLKLFIYLTMQIKVPYYIEIGEKDCLKPAGLTKLTYLKYFNGYKLFNRKKAFNYSVKDGDFVYIFVDGVKEHIPSKNGYYREDTIKWLDKELTKYKNKTVIIFQHFPLFSLKDNSASNLYKPEMYTDMLKKHNNILAIFAGHYMENIEKTIDGGSEIHFVTPPAEKGKSQYREVNISDLGNKKYEIYSQIVKF